MTATRQAFYKYIHTSNTLQVFVGGKPLSAPATNVGVVNAVLAAIHDPKTTDEDIIALMDVKKAAVTVLGKLPGAHVRHEDGEDVLYVDDIKVPKVLTEKVLDIIAQGGDVDPWYLCLEKCRQNPWRDAIEMFCQLMDRWGTPITTDGDLLFVKSVRSDYYDRYTGTIRYTIGEVIADQKLIDNPKLTDSSRAACSNGLHFGPWKGAKTYYDRNNGRYLLVTIDPRDVINVDLGYPKGRALKMRVVDDVPQGADWADKVWEPVVEVLFPGDELTPADLDPTLAAIVNEETRSHRSRPAKKASNADKRRQRALKPHKAEKAAPNGPAAKKAPARPVIGSVDTKWAGRLTKAEFKKLQAQHGSLAAMARLFGISQGTVQATKTKLGL
jgi:hypothetical protein